MPLPTPGSNVTQATEVVTTTRITNYTYNLASQLSTSKVGVKPTTWYYAFDNNGNLREMTPSGSTPEQREPLRVQYR